VAGVGRSGGSGDIQSGQTTMSTKHKKRRNKKSPDVSDESVRGKDSAIISVTQHARLRYLQRVDAAAANPTQELRRLFRTASPARGHAQVDAGRARRAGDTLVVYRGSEASPTIVTVLRARDGGAR
jgi:hypothetical protein